MDVMPEDNAAEVMQTRMNQLLASASIDDFWTNPCQDQLNNNITGAVTTNGAITFDKRCFGPESHTIPSEILNNSLGDGYPSNGDHTFESLRFGGGMTDFTYEVNPVRIHTPIHNEIQITSPSTNQLDNLGAVPGDYKIVTLGDEFTVRALLDGNSVYYTSITTALSKYVKKVEIYCGVCDRWYEGFEHNCRVPIGSDDNKTYEMKTRVIALNSGPTGTANEQINQPDDIYILEQSGGIYVVGKIYDLQVRATNDPDWKNFRCNSAEKLHLLPIGEERDNKTQTYKTGIKLGYRAFFDLKTLGSSNQSISIKPKIYYVDKNGNIKTNVELWYRDGANSYAKLSEKDITIKMNMSKTEGLKYNPEFTDETTVTRRDFTNVDYTKTVTIGGLRGILLSDLQNSLRTKYDGYYRVSNTGNRRLSMRWYGEIYIPASTIVAESGATVTQVSRGEKTLKEGYLVLTFSDITSLFSSGANYLKYSIGRDADGVQFSPNGTNLVSPSIMYNEKTNNGAQALKASIKLPNGRTFSSYPQTDAPIIVYDVSLRANNDLEDSGTH